MKTLLVLSLFVLTSCATIIASKNQDIEFVTEDGDQVEATLTTSKGSRKIKVPGVAQISRDEKHLAIKIDENACYKRSTTHINIEDVQRINPWFWGNFISSSSTLGSPGITTDYATGAVWKYDDTIYVNTTKKDSCRR